jgi:TPR repeat protein
MVPQGSGTGACSGPTTLGLLYSEGLGVPRDSSEAFKWFRMAADRGFEAAERRLYANC